MTTRRFEDDLSRLAPFSDADLANFVDDGRLELLQRVLESADQPAREALDAPSRSETRPARRHRVRPAAVAALAVVTVGGAGAVAWAATSSDVADTTSVECVVNGSDAIVPSTSGDPVVDCTAVWRQLTGSGPPPLVAYDNGLGGVTVQPASMPVPKGFTRLPAGTVQNGSVIELQESLDDYVAGLNSSCYTSDEATTLVEGELQRLGFEGWTVTPASTGSSGGHLGRAPHTSAAEAKPAPGVEPSTTSCFENTIVDPERHEVELLPPVGPPSPGFVPVRLAAELRTIATSCEALPAATAAVEQAAANLGLSQSDSTYDLTTVQEDVPCTRIYESVGGTIFLVLRGPSS